MKNLATIHFKFMHTNHDEDGNEWAWLYSIFFNYGSKNIFNYDPVNDGAWKKMNKILPLLLKTGTPIKIVVHIQHYDDYDDEIMAYPGGVSIWKIKYITKSGVSEFHKKIIILLKKREGGMMDLLTLLSGMKKGDYDDYFDILKRDWTVSDSVEKITRDVELDK